jgi:hypothetical protein
MNPGENGMNLSVSVSWTAGSLVGVESLAKADVEFDDPWQAGHRDDRRSRTAVSRDFKRARN